MQLLAVATVVICLMTSSAVGVRVRRVELGTLSSLRSAHVGAVGDDPRPLPPAPPKPLHAIKMDEGGDDWTGDADTQAISIVFDAKLPWKADEQSLVSSALNRRYGISTTALDAMRCKCTKSNDKESLLGSVDHTVSCDCL